MKQFRHPLQKGVEKLNVLPQKLKTYFRSFPDHWFISRALFVIIRLLILHRQFSLTDCGNIKDSADDGHQQDRAHVVEEHAVGHEVARIQDDGRQHVEEERVRRQRLHIKVRRVVEDDTNYHTHDNQEARLGKHSVELGRHVETWNGRKDTRNEIQI